MRLRIGGLVARLGLRWCRLAHRGKRAPMWPVNGRYECRDCGRMHRVYWEDVGAQLGRIHTTVAGVLYPAKRYL